MGVGGAARGGDGWDFFVSYTQPDQPWAEWISWVLEEVQFRVLVQAWDFPPGSNWVEQMRRGVRADRTVVVLSNRYPGSRYGAAEWRQAWLHDPAGDRRKVLVVRVEDCRPPDVLEQVVYIDLVGLGHEEARDRLLRSIDAAVHNLRLKPSEEPPFPGMSPRPGVAGVPQAAGRTLARRRPSAELLPGLPARYVPRDGEVAAVCRLLTDPAGETTVGIVGMGGAGKSTLARALIHQEQVKAAFTDGILWVDASPDIDLTTLVATVVSAFGDPAPLVGLSDGVARARRLLAGAACLIVVDNVWSVEVLRALPLIAPARLLVTTRSRDSLFTSSEVYLVGGVDNGAGRQLLARYAGCQLDELPAVTEEILTRCGGLVLALALVGGMVGEGRPWVNVLERLRRADLSRLTGRFPDYPSTDLLAALDISVSTLDDNGRDRFTELAIFHGPVPAAVVIRLWQITAGLDDLDADDLLRLLGRRSLVQIDPRTDQVTVHDLLLDYARAAMPTSNLGRIHLLLAADLLTRWGGLGKGLPRLRDQARLDDIDQYGTDALVNHLLSADRADLVDELLTVEWDAEPGRAHNAWYTVHENLGQTDTYLSDVRAAWRHAADHSRLDGLNRQAFYALIIGSISSIAARMHPDLLVRAVALRVWPLPRALAYALAIPMPEGRAQALTGLIIHLDAEKRRTVLDQALDAAIHISEPQSRARALARLVTHLDVDRRRAVLDRALDAADHIDHPDDRARVLAGLAADLDADQVVRALDAAARIDALDARVRALAGLAAYLEAAQRRTVLDQALDSTIRVVQPLTRARALALLAAHLDEDQLSRALDAAVRVVWPTARAHALAGLAGQLNADQLARALDAAIRIDGPDARARALIGLAPRLDAMQRHTVMNRALDAVARINHPDDRARALAGLAAHLAGDQVARALDTAISIDRPEARSRALIGLASHLDVEQRGMVLDQALDAAMHINRPGDRARAMARLAVHFDAARRRAVLDRALEAANHISRPVDRAQELALLAVHLDADQLARALDTAVRIDHPDSRLQAMGGLAAHLDLEQRGAVLDQALEAITRIDHPAARARALAGLITLLGTDQPARALDAATRISKSEDRAWALARALDTATRISKSEDRARALTGLVAQLDADQMARVLEAVTRFDWPGDRARVLVGLVAHFEGEKRRVVLEQVLAAAVGIDRPDARAHALAGLIAHFEGDQRGVVLEQALAAAIQIDRPVDHARLLVGLVAHFEGEKRRVVLEQVLAAAV
ncbi:TIR domain-containing protein, partial [Frankia sp. AiPs1]|uniref:TIR domain-containing protein n=1 Tax=Frankia sp. AiPs1 TaxID=573493 RepID=UPI0020445D8C